MEKDDSHSGYVDEGTSQSARIPTNEVLFEREKTMERLGSIHVLGMGRTASQDQEASRIASIASSGHYSLSNSALTDQTFSPAMRTLELSNSPSSNHPPGGSQVATGNHSTMNSRSHNPSPLHHKDSFGQHHSRVPLQVRSATSSMLVNPSTKKELQVDEEVEVVQSDSEKMTAPTALVDSLWSSVKEGDVAHNISTQTAADGGGLILSNIATLGGPLSPFANSAGHQSASQSSPLPLIFSQHQSGEGRTSEEAKKESNREQHALVASEEDTESKDSRKVDREVTPRNAAARQTVSTRAAPSNGGPPTETNAPLSERVKGSGSTSNKVASAARPIVANNTSSKSSRIAPLHRPGPQLPSAPNVASAPPPAMYWSRVPVHGSVPRRSFRAHTATLSDEVMWLFGGCDSKGCFRELWCFDTETMCWSKPKVTGDLPPPRRAHTATMVDKRLFVFAGGDGPYYFNDLYVFDTVSLRWSKPDVFGQAPSPRRAHTSNFHNGRLIIFGGGNGVGALNDVFSLDIADPNRLEWKKVECEGKIPIGRGYHTSNLVDGKLIVIGGSDGHMSFNDIHILRLDTRVWYQVKTDEIHNRLGHTATQVGSYLFVVGGHDSQTYTSDILTLNLVNLQWEPRRVCGMKPPGRGYHQAWLRDSRLFIHGGFDGKEIYDDLYYVDLAACAYLPQITSFSVELDEE
ncbi:hypothetical protein CBS101457_001559 [Exobasidium rhododendri]|nr:hypothetical protein CBS101457_001559 [Exobasidium rhododendri]